MDELHKYSNPPLVREMADFFLGKDIPIYYSTRKDKKYMIINPDTHKRVYFGQMGYEDFTKHLDYNRRHQFRQRNASWASAPKYSPAWLSYYLLW